MSTISKEIKAIVGLGNPGPTFKYTPHNIGFLIADKLCDLYGGIWTEQQKMLFASVTINDQTIVLIKPQTFMNNSGEILSSLRKRGITVENLLVIHDEIDFPFGKISLKDSGSARGHNGVRSIIAHGSEHFLRLRCGVGRPENSDDVGNFVTRRFEESSESVDQLIQKAVEMITSSIIVSKSQIAAKHAP